MILQRITHNLRAQNWTAIGIEFLIVVAGVFLGTQVANWNQGRVEKAATQQMMLQLVPELQSQIEFVESVRTYYATSRRYADEALAGWKAEGQLSDRQFVIAAYQASQITGIGTNAENWALTFGGQQLRNIDNPKIRRTMELILTADYGPISQGAVASPYREQVRRAIPIQIQDDIRRECGDRIVEGKSNVVISVLPETCALQIPPGEAAAVATALRAKPHLADELNWHLAVVAVFLTNVDIMEVQIRELHRDLSKLS